MSVIERPKIFVANAIDTLEKLKLHPDFNFEENSQHRDDFFKYLEYVNDQLDKKILQGECAHPKKGTSSKMMII